MHFHVSQNLDYKNGNLDDLLKSSTELHRKSEIFFVGADLPVFETVETIIESHPGRVELFVIVLGDVSMIHHNLEMIRVIKRNFPVRILVILHFAPSRQGVEQLFAAGADLFGLFFDGFDKTQLKSLSDATTIFPHSSTVAFLSEIFWNGSSFSNSIKKLVFKGVIPLPLTNLEELKELEYGGFERLLDVWQNNFYITPLSPLISLLTPVVAYPKDGFFHVVAKHIKNRHELAKNQLERHLRCIPAENSLDSAGL